MQENQQSPASLDDIDKAMQGLLALAQHLKASDEAAVSLSRVSAASASVRQGETAAYQIKLLNQSQAHLWLGLVVDIYSRENPVHPDGHHAYFRKEIFVPGRASRELAFHYNWRDLAAFVIDGIAFAPDSAWFGPCRAPAGYLVRAQLHSEEGDIVEELQLLQRLSDRAPEREIP